MSVLNQTISDTNFPDDEVSFVINKWKNQFPAVEKISVSLQRSQDKISGKHVHDCIGEAEAAKQVLVDLIIMLYMRIHHIYIIVFCNHCKRTLQI